MTPRRMPHVAALSFLLGCSGIEDGEVGVYPPPEGQVAPPPVPTSSTTTRADSSMSGTGFEDFPEADASSGQCVAGVYMGGFNCQASDGGPAITGDLSLTLEEAMNGELLEIRDGTLSFRLGEDRFVSELSVQLDCSTGAFHAKANGFAEGDPALTFSGSLDGELHRPTQTLTGTWSLTFLDRPPCMGFWSVVRVRD